MSEGILPELFLERLKRIVPEEDYDACLKSFSTQVPLSIRVNTLKVSKDVLVENLERLKISYEEFAEIPEAFVLRGISVRELQETEIFQKGYVYCQGFSSMLPVMILDPRPGERVLDMCAAPGSKTTQMAARMQNEGEILALEAIRARYYKLRAVVSQQGAGIVSMRLMDARRFRPPIPRTPAKSRERRFDSFESSPETLFDKVLVDAPCSSESRFKSTDPKTFAYWSPRKIDEMAHKQRGILLNASRWLKVGGDLVYSTCSFSPEENEGVVDWFLRKTPGAFEVAPIDLGSIATYPATLKWNKREYAPALKNCARVLPNDRVEGFFICKLKKLDVSALAF